MTQNKEVLESLSHMICSVPDTAMWREILLFIILPLGRASLIGWQMNLVRPESTTAEKLDRFVGLQSQSHLCTLAQSQSHLCTLAQVKLPIEGKSSMPCTNLAWSHLWSNLEKKPFSLHSANFSYLGLYKERDLKLMPCNMSQNALLMCIIFSSFGCVGVLKAVGFLNIYILTKNSVFKWYLKTAWLTTT
jgi:hypothetical protein